MRHRKEVDGLRAIAIIPVIFFHAGFSTFSGGFVGVDVFFVISGYLITSIILAEKQAGAFSIINFYERRARRILPALFVVMLSCLPFAWLWLLPDDMKSFSQSLVAVTCFSSNLLFYLTSGYFDTATQLKPLLHTWSLAVEEQYYLLFPIFLFFTWRLGKNWIVGILIFLACISLATAEWGSIHFPEFTFYLLPTRGWEILIGSFVAFYLINKEGETTPTAKLPKTVKELFSFAGLSLILFAVFTFNDHIPFPGLYALVPTIGTALILLFANQQTFTGKFLSNKAFVGIGLISYSAYLWHQPLFAFARYRSIDEPDKTLLTGLAICALILAYLSWKFIETPFRNKQLIKRNHVFYFSSVFGILFILIGLSGHFQKGYKLRLPNKVLEITEAATVDVKHRDTDNCTVTGSNYNLINCIKGNITKPPKYAIIGDSQAESLISKLNTAFSNTNLSFIQYTKIGCFPDSTEYFDFNCAKFLDHAFEDSKNKDIDTYIIQSLWAAPDRIFDLSKSAVFLAYKNNIINLVNADKRVILIYPTPMANYDIPVHTAKKMWFGDDSNANDLIDYDNFLVSNKMIYEALDEIGEHKNLIRIKPEHIFCNTYLKDKCITELNGLLLYLDSRHLSSLGASYVVNEIMKQI